MFNVTFFAFFRTMKCLIHQVFASIKSPDNEQDDYTEELLISPCKGVLQYVWPNVSTPSIAFMLIARVQCSKLKKSEDQAEIQNYELYG